MAAKKTKIGYVVEIATKHGFAYAQFYQYHEMPPRFGALLRILPGFFTQCPNDLKELVDRKEVFSTFFPLQAAVNRDIVHIIGRELVPDHAIKFPLFRAGNRNPATGMVEQWWLWDGINSWRVGALTDEQWDLPIQEICNDSALIQRIEEGWTPRKAQDFQKAARLAYKTKKDEEGKPEKNEERNVKIKHFILFKNKQLAARAATAISAKKETVNIIDNGDGYSVIVQQKTPFSEKFIEDMAAALTEIALKYGGVYDAWETALAE